VAQQRSGHLTIEQLSALLDKQLSPQEWALCQAHLRTCQQCQGVLADLRQTSVLLRALPQPELPRSFVLPATITSPAGQISRPGARATVTPITRGRRSAWPTYLRVSTRFISTIAAALGIIFLLSGLLVSLPRGGSTTSASAPGNAPSYSNTASHGVAQTPQARAQTPTADSTQNSRPKTRLPQPVGTATDHAFSDTAHTGNPVNTLPPLLDPGTIEGRVVIGVLLLILGILGVIFTRRRQVGSG
jgi:anti-sigma factor RsiW